MKRILLISLLGLSVLTIVMAGIVYWTLFPHLLSSSASAYSYYALKEARGFVLARSPKGNDGQPLGSPQPLISFGNGFGLAESDSISSLQLSPDGGYLAMNGVSDHGEQVWMYDAHNAAVATKPDATMGNFLHWLPGGNGHSFLFRPMFPLGPDAPMNDDGSWNPGLWIVDANTGEHRNIDIGAPSAYLVDAIPSPDGSRIVYSTSAGLGLGSDTFVMKTNGTERTHLFHNDGLQAIAGLFSWSPDGSHIAYERLADSAAPFLPSGLWLMDSRGGQQQRLADADGGHGYTISWSPDSKKIAFVMRMNANDHLADIQLQKQQSAIGVVDIQTQQVRLIASSAQTGLPMNINPVWSAHGDKIIFVALNPMNKIFGGTPRYWLASAVNLPGQSQIVPITPMFTHVVAWG